MRALVALTVVSAACLNVASGCGGSSSTAADSPGAEDTVRSYLRAVFDLDGPGACAQLSDTAREELVDAASLGSSGPRAATCPDAIALLGSIGSLDHAAAGVMDFDRVGADAADSSIETVESKDDSAVVRVDRSEKTVAVRKEGETWVVEALDFSDVPGG
jgi:hypothetical protein